MARWEWGPWQPPVDREAMVGWVVMRVLVCCKCGGTEIHTAWHRGDEDCLWGDRQKPRSEHLHYHCRRCSYDWTGPTRDQERLEEVERELGRE